MRPRSKRLGQHRTPEEAPTLSCSQRPAGDALNLCEKSVGGGRLVPSDLSQDIPIHTAEVDAPAASRKRKPISRASKRPRGQLRPCQDLPAPAEDPSALASSAQHPQQKPLAGGSQNSALPKVFHKTRRGRRDPAKLAAAMERVRQWEIGLLQNLEEAAQHHLTIETEAKKPASQERQFTTEDQPEPFSQAHTGHRLLRFLDT